MTCHVMPFLASSGHNWGAGVVMICTIPRIPVFTAGIVKITFSQK